MNHNHRLTRAFEAVNDGKRCRGKKEQRERGNHHARHESTCKMEKGATTQCKGNQDAHERELPPKEKSKKTAKEGNRAPKRRGINKKATKKEATARTKTLL